MGRNQLQRASVILIAVSLLPSATFAQADADCASSQRPARDEPPVRIIHVRFAGARLPAGFPAGDLRDFLLNKTWRASDAWRTEIEDEVRAAWQGLGFFRVEVQLKVSRLHQRHDEQAYEATFEVKPGEQYRLKSFDVEHAEPGRALRFSSVELRDLIPLSDSQIFDTAKIRQGLSAVQRKYAAEGYMDATTDLKVELNAKDRTATARVEVEEGIQYTFGRVYLPRNLELADFLRSRFKSGETFDYTRVEKALAEYRGARPADPSVQRIEFRREPQSRVIDVQWLRNPPGCTDAPAKR